MANDIGPTTVCLEDGEPFYGNKHVEKKRRRNHRLLSHHNLFFSFDSTACVISDVTIAKASFYSK